MFFKKKQNQKLQNDDARFNSVLLDLQLTIDRVDRLEKRLDAQEKKQHISGDKVKRLSRKVNKRKKK